MVNNFLENIDFFDYEKKNINILSPLVLAYIGDIVYEVYIRTMLINKYNFSVHKLHLKAIEYVSANSQADIVRNIIDKLSDEELRILKRGRNAKSGTVPKNVNIIDYKYATGFESLIGYLYLNKEFSRLKEIIISAIDFKMRKNKSTE
ncbi:MAG: ribonuclease III domain-containing protein [Clostridiales bacterium]